MKILLSILISAAMFANEVQINESNVSDAGITAPQEQQTVQNEESGITAKDVVVAVATPVVVAGAVVAAVVTSPVWLVKKIFE
ncbi:hypothetical protein [Sulfuricurvum sp.]|uniref:hypothetical protein n=1 Tax=Sulfuricurvum sp. TaxID=2025608 RepID=UPI002631BB71|nr:hypothetical protein [Sulfuricurvum sp.]MDD2780880.1 hypothetical protein [Sulfuricurvum sp.]MDD3595271.1 hypothetical protein [Sulfuricurvum sp.]